METPAGKSSLVLAWVAAILLIVLCGAGVAAMMGWIPSSLGGPAEQVLAQPAAQVPEARARERARVRRVPIPAARCADCGVIQSVRTVTGRKIEKRVKSYEITVHFDDGTDRVFTEASVPSWRNGDEVKIVDGVLQSNA